MGRRDDRPVTVEYQYRDSRDGSFGQEYLEASSIQDAQRRLLELSRGGDVEVSEIREVTDR
jgi:hypothetical protein